MFGNSERRQKAREGRARMAGDREAQGAALVRTDKQNAGELISQVAQLRAAQEEGNRLAAETNRLLAELVATPRPTRPPMPPPGYGRPAG